MRRSLIAGLACALSAVTFGAGAPTAVADPPTHEVQEVAFDVTLEGLCAFPVDLHVDQPKARTTTFFTKDGQVAGYLLSGAATATVANSITGESLTINISGPGHLDTEGNLIGYGPWLLAFFGDETTSEPFLVLATGRLVVSPTGNLLSYSGRIVDLCAALS
jgi:hypothetical protein